MAPSTMLPTPPATSGWSRPARPLILGTVLIIAALAAAKPSVPQERRGVPYVDLTTPPPTNQQGRGVPGASGGGTSAGPLASAGYLLPIRTEIVRTSVDAAGDLVVELDLENTGKAPFDFPASRDISQIERPENRGRRVFFFDIRRALSKAGESEPLGSATTAGSPTVPDSLVKLEPGSSVRILLRADSVRIKRALPKQPRQLEVRADCSEWTLEDNQFAIRATSENVKSENSIRLVFRDDKPIVAPLTPQK